MFRRLLLTFGIGFAVVSAALAPAWAQDAADMVVRLNRVENVARQLSGQIEQLQYENRQLKEQLRKFQEDVEFRFQEGRGGAKAPAAARPPAAAPAVDGTNPGTGKPGKRGDAFNPDQNPNAPGAPRQLGAATPSAPLPSPPPAPRTETRMPDTRMAHALPPDGEPDDMQDEGELPPPGLGGPVDLASPPGSPPSPARTANAAVEPLPAGSVAATGSGDARGDFDAAYALIQGRQFEQAEMSLRQFLQSHPRDKLVPKATYWLGESYLQRNRSREAAEQFLKVSTDYAASPVAPEAMMKLGASLNAMGAKAQACATLAEVERKYPSASPSVRQGIEREQKRARCTG